jgi:tripartite-type tricarboxylate transporter receptor subunit TctC
LLALSSARRLPDYPNVPTLAELGYPGLTGVTWFSVSGPPGMPRDIVNKLNAEIRRGLKTPAAQAQLKLENMVTTDDDAAAFTQFVSSEIERWTPPARSLLKATR